MSFLNLKLLLEILIKCIIIVLTTSILMFACFPNEGFISFTEPNPGDSPYNEESSDNIEGNLSEYPLDSMEIDSDNAEANSQETNPDNTEPSTDNTDSNSNDNQETNSDNLDTNANESEDDSSEEDSTRYYYPSYDDPMFDDPELAHLRPSRRPPVTEEEERDEFYKRVDLVNRLIDIAEQRASRS